MFCKGLSARDDFEEDVFSAHIYAVLETTPDGLYGRYRLAKA